MARVVTGDLRRMRGVYVAQLGSAIRSGASGLQDVPGLLKSVLDGDGWRDFVTLRDEPKAPTSFADFVSARPLSGLGSNVEQILRLVNDDAELSRLVRDAASSGQGRRSDLVDNINEVARPDGTSRAHALRRLHNTEPELHADVIAGKLSPHAAMVSAGLRPKTTTVRVADPESVARSLRKHMTAEDLARLRDLL